MALGIGHYLRERREVKRMRGRGRGESRGGQEYFRVVRGAYFLSQQSMAVTNFTSGYPIQNIYVCVEVTTPK